MNASNTNKFLIPKSQPNIVHISKIRCVGYAAEWSAKYYGTDVHEVNATRRGPAWLDIFRPGIEVNIRKEFERQGLRVEKHSLHALSDDEKIRWVQNQIAERNAPTLTLVIQHVFPHWILLTGYDEEKKILYCYNSRTAPTSTNDALPTGNESLSYDHLVRGWRKLSFLKHTVYLVMPRAASE